jgi:large conductance mechanosensitive channel
MTMLKEFRKFIARGNVLELAIGIMIGAAFNSVVSSFVSDIIMPPIGLLLGNTDFSDLFINLSGGQYESVAAAEEAGAATINYGIFINTVLDFVIIAFVLFLIVRQVSRMERKEEEKPEEPTTKKCPHCLTEILIGATRCPHCTSQLEEA